MANLDLGNLLVHLRANSSQFNGVMSGAISTMRNTVSSLTRHTKRMALLVTAQMTLSVKAFASFEEQRRIRHFAKYGYKTLIVWQKELKSINPLKMKLIEFHDERK